MIVTSGGNPADIPRAKVVFHSKSCTMILNKVDQVHGPNPDAGGEPKDEENTGSGTGGDVDSFVRESADAV
jgi:hypothetical protein